MHSLELNYYIILLLIKKSGVRESDPRTRLGKPVHYHCANTASI
jgi:hypothetical protein